MDFFSNFLVLKFNFNFFGIFIYFHEYRYYIESFYIFFNKQTKKEMRFNFILY